MLIQNKRTMLYQTLATIVAFIHFAFILFVILGGFLVLRWPVLVGTGLSGLTVLYAVGGPKRPWKHIVPGAMVATALAMMASLGVSYYVTELTSYHSLYGAFGGVMVVVLWFYACSLAVMIGAVVNTELRVPSDPALSRT